MHARSTHTAHRRLLSSLLMTTLAGSLVLTACGEPSPEEVQADRGEVTEMLESYLALLSDGYATGNLEPMRELAADKEVATVAKLVDEYAQQGLVIRPRLRQLTLEDLTVWNANNAYATTVEVWDLRKYVIGSEQLLSEALNQGHRVKYQLKRRPEGWQVMYRQAQPLAE
jgi:hypothetical protein